MPNNIIIGRSVKDKKQFGEKGVIFLGRHYVKMDQTVSLSSNIFMDAIRTHVVFVVGKRGTGKSYSLSVMAEGLSSLEEDISKNISVLMFDTMGIFWTMKYPNQKDEKLLRSWGMKPRGIDKVEVYVPEGYFKDYKEKGILVDHAFTIKTAELDAGDWVNVFGVDLMHPIGIAIEKAIGNLVDEKEDYGIVDIINEINSDKSIEKEVKDAAINRFLAAESWGLFSKNGTEIKELVKGGKISVVDISAYSHMAGNWGIKNLVVGIICKKLLQERMIARKLEELRQIESGTSLFGFDDYEKTEDDMPLVWILIDEAHEFLPREGRTGATDALVQLLREGRQPGISLVLASQQPGEIHRDVITQSDIVISHRLTARRDIGALNDIMQTYMASDIQRYLNDLPRMKGSAIILDDNSEKIFPVNIRPKFSWHGGEAPSALHLKAKELLDLGL